MPRWTLHRIYIQYYFKNNRTPLNMSYRIIYHHFIEYHDILGVANELDINWRTVQKNF